MSVGGICSPTGQALQFRGVTSCGKTQAKTTSPSSRRTTVLEASWEWSNKSLPGPSKRSPMVAFADLNKSQVVTCWRVLVQASWWRNYITRWTSMDFRTFHDEPGRFREKLTMLPPVHVWRGNQFPQKRTLQVLSDGVGLSMEQLSTETAPPPPFWSVE